MLVCTAGVNALGPQATIPTPLILCDEHPTPSALGVPGVLTLPPPPLPRCAERPNPLLPPVQAAALVQQEEEQAASEASITALQDYIARLETAQEAAWKGVEEEVAALQVRVAAQAAQSMLPRLV